MSGSTCARLISLAVTARAQDIRAIYDGDKREEAFRDHAAAILRDWRGDAANLTNYTRRLLGLNLLDPGQDALTALVDGGLIVANAASAGGVTSLLTSPFGPIVQVGSGIAVGLVSHSIKGYIEMRSDAGKSTCRYLTAMETAGVIFRSEIIPTQAERAARARSS